MQLIPYLIIFLTVHLIIYMNLTTISKTFDFNTHIGLEISLLITIILFFKVFIYHKLKDIVLSFNYKKKSIC